MDSSPLQPRTLSSAKRAVLAVALALAMAASVAEAGERVRVMPIWYWYEELGVDQDLAGRIFDQMAAEIDRVGPYLTFDQDEVTTAFEKRRPEAPECKGEGVSRACLLKIARLLSAGKVITGSVKADEQGHVLELTLLDVQTGETQKTVSEKLAGPPDDLPRLARKIVHRVMAGPPRAGLLHLAANVTGAEILIDGEKKGQTPHNQIWELSLPPGSHRLALTKDGYQEWTRSIMIAEGDQVVIEACVKESLGRLTVMTNPSGAAVLIDGASPQPSPSKGEGAATTGSFVLTPGSHTVKITHPDALDYEQKVTIEAGVSIMLDAHLAPRQAQAAAAQEEKKGGVGGAVIGGAVAGGALLGGAVAGALTGGAKAAVPDVPSLSVSPGGGGPPATCPQVAEGAAPKTAGLDPKELEDKTKALEAKERDLEAKAKALEPKAKELETKEKDLEDKAKAFEPKAKELEAKEKELEAKAKALEPKEKDLETKGKELETKEKELEAKELKEKEEIAGQKAKEAAKKKAKEQAKKFFKPEKPEAPKPSSRPSTPEKPPTPETKSPVPETKEVPSAKSPQPKSVKPQVPKTKPLSPEAGGP